jgi:hypothetical protein
MDRKDSTRGYTPDNIEVMSKRANTLKNNASAAEMKMVLKYLEENESSVVIYAQPAFGNG